MATDSAPGVNEVRPSCHPGSAPGQRTRLLRISKGPCPRPRHLNILRKHLPHARCCVHAEATEKGKKTLRHSTCPHRACLQQEGKADGLEGGMLPQCHTRGPWEGLWGSEENPDLVLDAGPGHPAATCRRRREPGQSQDPRQTVGDTGWRGTSGTWSSNQQHTSPYLNVELSGNGCEFPTSCE